MIEPEESDGLDDEGKPAATYPEAFRRDPSLGCTMFGLTALGLIGALIGVITLVLTDS